MPRFRTLTELTDALDEDLDLGNISVAGEEAAKSYMKKRGERELQVDSPTCYLLLSQKSVLELCANTPPRPPASFPWIGREAHIVAVGERITVALGCN